MKMRVLFKKTFLYPLMLLLFSLSAQGQGSDELIKYQLQKEGVTFSNDNSLALLISGQEKFDDMFEAIRQAKSSIHMDYFNFRNDSIAHLLFDLLAQKAKEGVEVRTVFDGWGNDSNNKPLKKSHLEAIRATGVQIYEFDPMRFPWINHGFSRDHRKIVVIDGKIAYTGGMNVADYYIKGTEQVGEWRDMHCRIEGEEVNTLQRIFLRHWYRVTGEDLSHEAKYYRLSAHAGGYFHDLKPDTTASVGHKTIGIVNREPKVSPKIMRQFYNNAINDAKDSIKIINPYFSLTHSVRKSLRNALKRGVKVEIMISAKSDIPVTPDVVLQNSHMLMKRGGHIWIYQPGFHHSKIMMVDGKFCTIGSANLNSRGTRFDFEENAVILDSCVTRQLDDMFERDKKKCTYLTPELWKELRTPFQILRGKLFRLLTIWI